MLMRRGGGERRVALPRAIAAFALIAASAIATIAPARAGERLARRYDWRSGQPVNYIVALVQDQRGFLWSLSTSGLVRFDGTEMTVWDPRPLVPIAGCGTSRADGPFLIHLHDRTLWRVRGEGGVEPVAGPGGETPYDAYRVACAADGVLWTGDSTGRYHALDRAGRWTEARLQEPERIVPNALWPGSGDEVFVVSARGVHRLGPGGIRFLAPFRGVVCVIPSGDSVVYVGANDPVGRVYRIDGDGVRAIHERPTRMMSLALRGETLWAAYDSGLFALRAGAPTRHVPVGETLPGGGPLLVDAEGSLWVGTHRGLVGFPEPEVEVLADEADVSRYVIATPSAIWWVCWRGVFRFDRAAPEKGLQPVTGIPSLAAPCEDAKGSIWIGGWEKLVEFPSGGGWIDHPLPGAGESLPCAVARDGGRWIPTTTGLVRLSPRGDLAMVPGPDAGGAWADGANAALEHQGRLWVAMEERICRMALDPGGSAAPESASARRWTCASFPRAHLLSMARAGAGEIWAADYWLTPLLRAQGESWSTLPVAPLPPSFVQEPPPRAPSSGIWLMGAEYLERVRASAGPEGYEVLEKLTGWHGLPTLRFDQIAEDPDGTLWLASNAGLIRVPADVRRSRPSAPRVALVESTVDGKRVNAAKPFTLPYRRNRLEVRFAALSFRAPELVRYRSRLRDADPWSEPTPQSRFRFMDLPPGDYHLTVEASLDGTTWSPSAASVAFHVDVPFYRAQWFYAALALLAAGAAFAAHRVRVHQVIRLERQRTRIAMDLHDAVGSGLGGIGIMAGLASRPNVSDEKRLELSSRIASVAREVGSTVGDIVWSLRPGEVSLEELAAHLVDRATALFPEGTAIEREFPSAWPSIVLTPEARRSAFLIGTEALHNAARHARPERVTIGLHYADGHATLRIADDGAGRPSAGDGREAAPKQARSSGGGLGVPGMRRRAKEIGASFHLTNDSSGGTVVELVFDPRASEKIT
jgi:signal transduction histidine kinase